MSSRTVLLLGQCVPCVKQNASKIRVRKMELDNNLQMFFKKDQYVFAYDPDKKCKTGDIVLLKELPQKLTKLITHSINDIVYPLGDIDDPITKKKVTAGKYRDDIKATNNLYGNSRKGFCYENGPPRGRLEGSKDFSFAETFIRYHETGNDDPFAV